MISGYTCKECGAAIPADIPGGFCARCLLGLALGKPPESLEPGAESHEGDPQEPSHPTDHARSPGMSASQPEKSGDWIGRYRLLEEIGHGGCGVVYMAEQDRPVRRRVALKVIKLGMDTRQVVARFEAERQALALMDHPSIAKVLEAGTTDAGRPYFVMELVGGIKITDYCNQNNLNIRQRLELFIRVCRGIQHAHQKGIIHRDIKPSNVLVATQDGAAAPKVIDFGIAKATQGRLTDQTLFTAFEQFLGTPAYMSPEQAQLGSLDVDTRSDIYSLGVLLYELLTGKTPFDTREMLAGGLDAMRRTIRETEPPKPSTRLNQELAASDMKGRESAAPNPSGPQTKTKSSSLQQLPTRELIKLVRGDVDWIVMKCLEKDRSRRYESVNGLAMDLERHLNQEPVIARPPSWSYTLHKFVRRNRIFVSAAALVAAALVLGVVASTWQAVRATRAELAQSRLREEAQTARQDATDKLWSARLAEARARRISGQSGQRYESLRAIREAAAIRPSLELRNEAIASTVLADIRWLREKASWQDKGKLSASPNLEYYAVMNPAGAVSVRRGSDDAELGGLPATGKPPCHLGALSPDGRYFVVTDADSRLCVWDWAKSAILFEGTSTNCSHGFSEDGKMLATSDGTNILIHRLPGGEAVGRLSLSGLSFESAAGLIYFDPSGQLLAMTAGDRTNLLVVDIKSGRRVAILPHYDFVLSLAWHPDGRHLATACAGTVIYIWDTATGERIKEIPCEQTVAVGFNREGNVLASSGWDGKTRLLEFPTGRQIASIYKSGFIAGFSLNDRTLATLNWDGSALEFFDITGGTGLRKIHERLQGIGQPGGTVMFSSSGRLVAYPAPEGVAIWDARANRIVGTLSGEDLLPLGFDAQEAGLLVETTGGIMRWRFIELPLGTVTNLGPPILVHSRKGGAVVSLDGKICAATADNGWRIFRMDSLAEQSRIVTPAGAFGITLGWDGTLLAIGDRFNLGVKVWNTRTGELLKELPVDAGHGEPSASVALSADGRYLVGSTVSEYCFWEVASWTVVRRIQQQPGNDFPAVMAFSRDGKVFAGTHSRNIVRLYNAANGQVLADLEAPNCRFLSSLSFNEDGTLLAACESRDILRIWNLRVIRGELAALNLDWEMPAYPPKSSTGPSFPPGTNSPAQAHSR